MTENEVSMSILLWNRTELQHEDIENTLLTYI